MCSHDNSNNDNNENEIATFVLDDVDHCHPLVNNISVVALEKAAKRIVDCFKIVFQLWGEEEFCTTGSMCPIKVSHFLPQDHEKTLIKGGLQLFPKRDEMG